MSIHRGYWGVVDESIEERNAVEGKETRHSELLNWICEHGVGLEGIMTNRRKIKNAVENIILKIDYVRVLCGNN